MTKTRSCTCEIRTKLVGDGCEICNPEKALEYAKETIAELRSQLTARERLLGEAKWVLETLRDVVEEHADPDCEFEESEDFCCHMCEEHGCMARKLAVIDSISPETKNV